MCCALIQSEKHLEWIAEPAAVTRHLRPKQGPRDWVGSLSSSRLSKIAPPGNLRVDDIVGGHSKPE